MTTNIVQFRCKHRHSAFSHPNCYLRHMQGRDIDSKRLPKVLVFDIETSPLKAFVFQKSIYKTNITDEQVISEWFALCWSAKWLFSDEILSDRLTGREAINEDDKRISKSLWKLLDECEIAIAHNGDSFDIPNMNTRFIINGLLPTSPYQTIDTKAVAKKQFGFTHNTLDALAKLFGLGEKKKTDFELWTRCVDGEDNALRYMQDYNKGDVQLLEEVYLKLRPWIKGHPNLGLFVESDGPVCPNCGSINVDWTGKFYYTQTGKYETYHCSCGAFGRSRTNSYDKELRKSLGVGLAK